MALVEIIRKVVPRKVISSVGVWALSQASKNWLTLKWYLTLLYGKSPENMGLDHEYCYYDHKGRRILAPRNAAGVFLEIFQDEVYEQEWGPTEGEVVLDIGAYVGMFTVKMASLVGAAGRVIAVEPDPENYEFLERNCRGLSNVTLVKKAIMSTIGIEKLYHSRSAAGNSLVTQGEKYVEVETVTLDSLVIELKLTKLDIIKIDAERAEIFVLRGGMETLRWVPRLVMAIYHTTQDDESNLVQTIMMLHKAGYKITRKRGLRSYLYAEKTI